MRKRGFTLIELLAVVVILAIVALIATPIVINIINDSKISSEKESIKIYLDTVAKSIVKRQMEKPTFKPKKCTIDNKKIICDNEEIEIEIKGQIPESGTIKFGNGMTIEGINIKLNELYYQATNRKVSEGTSEKSYRNYITLISDVAPQGPSKGDKYMYQVNDTDKFNFYILSVEENKVNLIMDRSICNNGTVTYTETNNYCRYVWHISYDNTYGPDTAMMELYEGTKDWDNVDDMIINYIDENNTSSYSYGYTSIKTTNGITLITGKPTTKVTTIGTNKKPLKARLPKLSEVIDADCTGNEGTCPVWLIENMHYSLKYSSINNNTGPTQEISGYWILSSYPDSSYSYIVHCNGLVALSSTANNSFSLRPVITVSKSDLQ